MTATMPSKSDARKPAPAAHRQLAGRLWRLAMKELREILRDQAGDVAKVYLESRESIESEQQASAERRRTERILAETS